MIYADCYGRIGGTELRTFGITDKEDWTSGRMESICSLSSRSFRNAHGGDADV